MSEIRASTVLPARREPVTLHTADGLDLVGELARPADRDPVATLICLHPLPTHGGMMDSHILRKASYRLPALADLAVLRFNTRGTSSEQGRSQGEFGDGETERYDVAAAVDWAIAAGLPRLWLVGWSFGTELALKWGAGMAVEGAILLSPALHRAGDADLDAWAAAGKPLLVLVPELDDYLRPDEARQPVRPGAAGRADRGGPGQAPLGRGALRPYRAERDRAPGEPGRRAATHRVEGLSVPLFDLTGKKAFITGASRGIGQAIAVALAGAGADLALVARSEDGLAETAAQVTALGRKAFVIPADVTQQEPVAAAVAGAIDQLGYVDIVVNNAGGSSFMVPFLDLRLTGWDKLIRLNLDSAMYVCHAIGPHLVERGSGSVINVASVAGVSAAPFLAPYGAAKAGLISLTKSLAVEWAAQGIRVNALCPGWTATDLNRNLWEDETAGPATVATVPMRRWGRADEMSGPAVFLASEASSYMTGQVLLIDGGQTAIS